jgi:histidinol-phosphatase
MDGPGLKSRTKCALDAARAAGELTLRYFRDRALSVRAKADGSPVTVADQEAEELIRRMILERFPGDGVMGEEGGEVEGSGEDAREGFRWVVDPIDGTKSFVQGVPLYGVLVGVEFAGRSVAGVIHMPALRETVYAAEGEGAWHVVGDSGPAAARVSGEGDLGRSVGCVTGLKELIHGDQAAALGRLAASLGTVRGWSDCYAHLLVATGRAEAAIEPAISPWDVAAVIPIMREAGGRYTDWSGQETAYSGTGLSTNGRVHAAVLELLAGRPGAAEE